MLSELQIKALKPRERGDKIVYDNILPGFGCRITPNGIKSFVLTHGRQRRRVTLGRVGIVSLQEARTAAKTYLAELTLGKTQPHSISWLTARDEYLAHIGGKRRTKTHDNYSRALAYFKFGETKLTDITQRDIERVLDRLSDRPTTQFCCYRILTGFFKWAYKKRYLDHNPAERMQSPDHYKARERILTDEELVKVWEACSDDIFGRIVRLLILTGQRRGEIAQLTTDMIGDGIITLPTWLTKNGREHSFPIGISSRSIFPSFLRTSTLLFQARGQPTKPYNGWSKSKATLDERSGVSNWTLHDLRRTAASGWQKLKIPSDVIEALLNHMPQGIRGVYQRHNYADEKREALERWDNHIHTLITAKHSS